MSTARRICFALVHAAARNPLGPTRRKAAVMTAETRMAVPVAKGWKSQTAA